MVKSTHFSLPYRLFKTVIFGLIFMGGGKGLVFTHLLYKIFVK